VPSPTRAEAKALLGVSGTVSLTVFPAVPSVGFCCQIDDLVPSFTFEHGTIGLPLNGSGLCISGDRGRVPACTA